jgi:hypothetical protein
VGPPGLAAAGNLRGRIERPASPAGGSWAPKEPGNLTYASDLPSCQVIAKENGFGVIDPHGDLVEDVKGYLTLTLSREELEERVVLIDPTDEKYTVAFNPLESSAELVEAFKKTWADAWGARPRSALSFRRRSQ